jgi:hypothetical protein
VLGRKQGNDMVYSFAYRLRRVEAILVKFHAAAIPICACRSWIISGH